MTSDIGHWGIMVSVCTVSPRQPSAAHVEAMVESLRNSVEILKRISDCLSKECESWISNIQALRKAKADEEAIERKEQERQDKMAKKAAEREAAKQRKAEEASAKAAAKAAAKKAAAENADQNQSAPNEADGTTTRKKRKTHGGNELDENDPVVLKMQAQFAGGAIAQSPNVLDFVTNVARRPEAACVAKLKKGIIKKVLIDSR